jgi:hypothetical protein
MSVLLKLPGNVSIVSAALCAAFSSGTAAQSLERPLTLTARQSFAHDSNVFQLNSSSPPPAIYGTSKKGDSISTTSLGLAYGNSFGTQNFSLSTDVSRVQYANLDQLNRTIYQLAGRLDGDLSPVFYHGLNVGSSRLGTLFANQSGFSPNLVASQNVGLTLGFRFNPTWSTFVGVDRTNRENSALGFQASDTKIAGKEIGLRYQPQSGIDVSGVIRNVSNSFSAAQIFDSLGNPLPIAVSNNNDQRQFFMRVNYQPNAISSLTTEIGRSSVSYDSLAQRNSSGLLLRTTYNYALSEAWNLSAKLARDTSVAGSAFASNIINTNVGVAANWKATARTSFRVNYDFSRRDFKDDPSVVLGSGVRRKDSLSTFGMGTSYELLRTVNLNMVFAHNSRLSNIAAFQSNSNTLTLSADWTLR